MEVMMEVMMEVTMEVTMVSTRLRSSGEMIWSASNSRHGSSHDISLGMPPGQEASGTRHWGDEAVGQCI